jgi:2-polyprenyl-3-methyl-5-hydroxy-6-metoxy-1,4-benzoquinol methylase
MPPLQTKTRSNSSIMSAKAGELQSSLDDAFEHARDEGFRARAIAEYKRVTNWVGAKVDLANARILDFGCGQGIAAASFAIRMPGATVVGSDMEPVNVEGLDDRLRQQIARPLPRNLEFVPTAELQDQAPFDLIYSWSVFEHVPEDQMIEVFRQLKSLLRPGGLIFVLVNPLFFSPRGSHLYRYFKSPWHHLLLPLSELREGVFAKGVTETQTREWQQFLGLNRLTARDILGRASASGLKRTRDAFFRTDLVPPPRLSRIYDSEALATVEFMALFE